MKAPWVLALGATLLMQTVASFLGQCLPAVAPLLTASTGIAPERIGNLSSLTSLGSVLFLACGNPLLARFGPVRSLQAGAVLATLSIVLAAAGWWPGLVLAALLLGVSYGPTPPAGSRILAATAPPEHRTLIFSLKQAGAPAGGAMAGLLIAPLAWAIGWRPALLGASLAGLAAALCIAPVRRMMDAERDPNRPIHPRALFHWRALAAPAASLRSDPLLIALTLLAMSFAVVQGCLFSFSVTYLVEKGLDLPTAGTIYACLQGAGVVARILLGWLADRTGRPSHNLTAQAWIAAALLAGYGLLPAHPPLWLAAVAAAAVGFVGASWNGIYMAEVARLSPPEKIVDATSASTMFTFLGYVFGPSIFSVLVTATGGWTVPFLLTAAQLIVMAAAQTVFLLRRPLRVADIAD